MKEYLREIHDLIKQLEAIASKSRKIIETIRDESPYPINQLQRFPGGACEVSSVLIGLYLKHLGMGNVSMRASAPPKAHVWLVVCEKYTMDITADQFDDCNEKIIVSENSSYHKKFEPPETRPVDNTYFEDNGWEDIEHVYKRFLELMKSSMG